VVRQYASEFAEQLHGLDVSLPAILPSAVLRHFKPRMVSALPIADSVHRDQAIRSIVITDSGDPDHAACPA
jgi:hypothetical protein